MKDPTAKVMIAQNLVGPVKIVEISQRMRTKYSLDQLKFSGFENLWK